MILYRMDGTVIADAEPGISIAELVSANRANLSGADLRGADLSGADLSRAYLRGADLCEADLSRATGNNREVISMQSGYWPVTRTAEVMQIGCARHPITRWWAFTDTEIDGMDPHALTWWRTWKPILQAWTAAAPATPTGHEEEAP